MPSIVSDIQVSSNVESSKNLEQYFPSVISLGQKSEEDEEIAVKYALLLSVSGTFDYPTTSLTGQAYSFYNVLENTFYFTEEVESLYINTNLNFNIGQESYSFINISNRTVLGYKQEWLTYVKSDLEVGLISKDATINTYLEYDLYGGVLAYYIDINNEITLADAFFYYLYLDIYSSGGLLQPAYIMDTSTIEGRISYSVVDIYSTVFNIQNINFNVYSSKQVLKSIDLDMYLIYGNLSNIQNDAYSSQLAFEDSIKNDIRLHSLEIDNFSLPTNKYAYFGEYLTVDIIDILFEIDKVNTFFEISGVKVNTFFTDIANGVRASCFIDNIFVSDGDIYCKIVAHNKLNDLAEKTYVLLYGNSIELNSRIKFDFNKQVSVVGCANNEVNCPNTECNSFVFETQDYPSYNLKALISCVISEDITAEIYPQSTAFFYGREYEIVISGIKDYSGNYILPTKIVFRIEELPIN